MTALVNNIKRLKDSVLESFVVYILLYCFKY